MIPCALALMLLSYSMYTKDGPHFSRLLGCKIPLPLYGLAFAGGAASGFVLQGLRGASLRAA